MTHYHTCCNLSGTDWTVIYQKKRTLDEGTGSFNSSDDTRHTVEINNKYIVIHKSHILTFPQVPLRRFFSSRLPTSEIPIISLTLGYATAGTCMDVFLSGYGVQLLPLPGHLAMFINLSHSIIFSPQLPQCAHITRHVTSFRRILYPICSPPHRGGEQARVD